ncbi:hypothetical protein [uncultured Xylophilus sp.]|uniref:hypothetical protein n=1 Tax=uncultured Xylophilus sp. TaxID=296832 RepID=UPI0025CBF514|nr:hypothetical protein [uncultured Xylophilus sp.]
MRTTLDLDPSVLQAARALAAHQSVSLGRAVSDLALRGLRTAVTARTDDGDVIPTFYSRPDAQVVTLDDVKRCLDDET